MILRTPLPKLHNSCKISPNRDIRRSVVRTRSLFRATRGLLPSRGERELRCWNFSRSCTFVRPSDLSLLVQKTESTDQFRETVMLENIVSGGRLLGFNIGDWMLLVGGCLVSGLLTFLT
jgi:hypothetical protein